MAIGSGGQGSEAVRLGPLLRRVRAPNPSPMTFTGTNSYLVGAGEVAVIDPGPADGRHLAALLAALEPGERITRILVTHAHADHVALAPDLAARTGAEVLAFGDAAGAGVAGAEPGGAPAPGFRPTRLLADGAAVEGAGWALRAIHTPGHRGDHLCLAWGDRCFTGDHVMGWSTSIVSPPEGHMGAYMASLARLAAEPWRQFLPGHGNPVEDPAARLAELAAHRRAREAEILGRLVAGPAGAEELACAIYTDIAPHLLPAAARNVLAHLQDLAEQGEVIALPGAGAATLYRRR
jgi:hydroxyacylglutathione hydrolase